MEKLILEINNPKENSYEKFKKAMFHVGVHTETLEADETILPGGDENIQRVVILEKSSGAVEITGDAAEEELRNNDAAITSVVDTIQSRLKEIFPLVQAFAKIPTAKEQALLTEKLKTIFDTLLQHIEEDDVTAKVLLEEIRECGISKTRHKFLIHHMSDGLDLNEIPSAICDWLQKEIRKDLIRVVAD